jgi:hypothetical protein
LSAPRWNANIGKSATTEDRMGVAVEKEGGFVLTLTDGSTVYKAAVDEKTLKKVAELLGISKADQPKTRSIFIYRGK